MTTSDLDNIAAPHPLASALRPIVDAGKARALALEIVHTLLVLLTLPPRFPNSAYFGRAIEALTAWIGRACAVDTGQEQQRHPAERLDFPTIAAVADRMASQFWCLAKPEEPLPIERWALFDLATMLRRACMCGDRGPLTVRATEDVGHLREKANEHPSTIEYTELANAYEVDNQRHRAEHANTTDHLLPLIVEEARRMCAELRLDPAPIEAAIARFGGVPS